MADFVVHVTDPLHNVRDGIDMYSLISSWKPPQRWTRPISQCLVTPG